jgi:hypothetical protein
MVLGLTFGIPLPTRCWITGTAASASPSASKQAPGASASDTPAASPIPVVSKAAPGSVECGYVDDGKGGVVRLSCSNNECCSQYGT